VGVEQLRRGAEQGAAGGEPGRVDQAVDAAERGDRGRDRGLRLRDVSDVWRHEQRVRSTFGEFGEEGLARPALPTGDRNHRALTGDRPGNACAEAPRAAADEHDAVPEQGHGIARPGPDSPDADPPGAGWV
jgi:hypothetical protein